MCIKLIAIKESLYAHCSMASIRIKLVKESNWQNIYQDNKSIKNGEKETFSTIELNEKNKVIRWNYTMIICKKYLSNLFYSNNSENSSNWFYFKLKKIKKRKNGKIRKEWIVVSHFGAQTFPSGIREKLKQSIARTRHSTLFYLNSPKTHVK